MNCPTKLLFFEKMSLHVRIILDKIYLSADKQIIKKERIVTETFADIAREAIEEYNIKGNEQTLNTIAKQIKKYIEAYYDEGTEITEEIKNKLFTMNELGEYFRKMIDLEWRGKKCYLELANEMNKDHKRQVQNLLAPSAATSKGSIIHQTFSLMFLVQV
ncbi:hypothetical protein P7D33_09105 [Lactococcus petauri]|uniref:hypothetical protein n=1 Tax=Lactococcus TaxID=1357 RepID=UPI00051FCC1A|nr:MULTISPECIES: hypothetical protein [Lactococcus]MDN5629497.1 hypothetical protein [Lactococcus sp.]MBS4460051.1 hypothetical protein [Lactococcus petauri]MDT2620982.1 hypothetical protein [Lactococcus petauri]QQB43751.1 hypothetical protein I6H59_08895 [Lactococcus garvieae]QSQ99257.1 hypothetical protein J0J32_10020 [Lactococcus garvieae]